MRKITNTNYFSATLTEETIETIAQAIRDRFENKKFAIASCEYADSQNASPRLIVNAKFNSEWTTQPINEKVRVFKKGAPDYDKKPINNSYFGFSAGNWLWMWHVAPTDDHEDYRYAHFHFESDYFEVIQRAPAGHLHKHLFRAQE